uniref:Tc1-like transposase DDE domain-containing protein n=1 Tax=Clastoptera arizonana TaxID=38151 RepID=A0A1B6DT43_9HEMI
MDRWIYSRLQKNISKGSRLIIVHAGGEIGGVENALLVFKAGQKTGDYHNDMNAENYEKWIINKLLRNLPKNSIFVIDNAPYHNKLTTATPNSNSRKSVLITWLRERNIPCSETMLKCELYELVKINKSRGVLFRSPIGI